MADLVIPLRQTFPFIRGYAADEQGDLYEILAAAHNLTLKLDNGSGGTPLSLEVEAVAPGTTFTKDGAEYPVNFQADYSESSLSASTTTQPWRAKLRVQHDSANKYKQYVPRDGFFEIQIDENVTEA
jgi:hypothetical protein